MTIEFYPNSVDVLAGTAVGQDWKEVYHDDANVYELTEVTATPGYEIVFNFDRFRVDDDRVNTLKLDFLGWYEGNPAHNVKLYIYNWITEAWVALTSADDDFVDNTAEQTLTFYKETAPGFSSGLNGRVLIKIKHDSPGSAGHLLTINQLKLSAVILGTNEGPGQY